ncbi:uncharacterized protein LOC125501885 [Athalia rosae]|uniref:uncharacterized protein LOC125501885 n=1 Tax=Athalia rosae TaxID=37344 RepID=UPI0020334B7F|nr:uncharacterized protein LOC125501885 [Athalia rosae]
MNEFLTSGWIDVLKQRFTNHKLGDNESDLNDLFVILSSPFSNLATEYKRLKFYENSRFLIQPKEFSVGTSSAPSTTKDTRQLNIVNLNAQMIPCNKVLKTFLELPNVFDKIMLYVEKLKSSGVVKNIVQTNLWNSIEQKFNGKLVLPLILYFDDFEVNNPLGSHAGINKLGAIYYTIACIPREYSGMLENIFVAQLHNTLDQAEFGNVNIFGRVMNEVSELEIHGIEIDVSGIRTKVHFALSLISGDNLGLHAILGFNTSFNSNYSCRFCLADKPMLQGLLSENTEIIRTIENYSEDLSKLTGGIKEPCIFNELSSFHVTENIYGDTMHDLFEGVCRYDMAKVLNHLIFVDKLFSLGRLNDRIRFFTYGSTVTGNIPPQITSNALKKGQLITSASEMVCLVRHLGFIIGDLVPIDNEAWELYITLREIICIVMATSTTAESVQLLDTLVSEHHSLYLKLFNEPLKPKHHFLIHYPRIMTTIGPLKNISCMRFEAKHKELKTMAKVVSSRRNISRTLALKHQLKMCQRFIAKQGFQKRISWGVECQTELNDYHDYDYFKDVLPKSNSDEYISVSWVNVSGTVYKPSQVVVVDVSDQFLLFGEVQYILIDSEQEAHFLFINKNTLGFSKHVHAFEVTSTKSWGFIFQKNLITYTPYNVHTMTDGVDYVMCL